MRSNAKTPEEYIEELPEERKEVFWKLRKTILDHLPKGFTESMGYGMIGYGIPHSMYPNGYHCDPKQPLPFISIASQKNFIAVYHMGIYANEQLLNWYLTEYSKLTKNKPDIGKGCLRFKRPDQIPYDLIGELAGKISAEKWIQYYEMNIKPK